MKKSHFKEIFVYHTVTSAEETATEVDIDIKPSLPSNTVKVTSFSIRRAGVNVSSDEVVTYSTSTGIINVANGASTLVLTEGDEIVLGYIFVS